MSITVEIFSSPGCAKCGRARNVLRKMTSEIGSGAIEWREIDILEELDYAVTMGVLSTPAIAIDGELVFTGLPSQKKLRAELEARLEANNGRGRS